MLHRVALVATLAAISLVSRQAEACGCFAPPDPTVPIVQAGERILFAVNNGVVTAHIQIQYAGEAKDFGWLLPLPSVPTLKLGTEELFTTLINTTQPRYFVQTTFKGSCGSPFPQGPLAASAGGAESDSSNGGKSVLVTQASIGPYDYAVLRADSKTAMFDWLNANHYFIPTGTDATVGPYIHEGAYFLALKLKSGQSAGDIQPVVLNYQSDLPMIPIILTSVAAQPNMGIQVWMLGSARAIPRNYNHVVINDAQIDWVNRAQNYNDVVIRAISETPEKHAFITEYAGTSSIMVDQLDSVGRFGSTSTLAAITDPASFVEYLFQNGYPTPSSRGFFAPTLTPLAKSLVLAQLPLPPGLKAQGTSEDSWLQSMRFFLETDRVNNPSRYVGWTPTFDPAALAAQLDEKVVRPALEAGQLFRNFPKMTRLYTTLSPEDMNRDPVFSFNPSLPDVSRDHTAQMVVNCGLFTNSSDAPATLTTEQGFTFSLKNSSTGPTLPPSSPNALRIETLGEEGAPTILTDNTASFSAKTGGSCSVGDPLSLGLIGLVGLLARRRRQS